MNNDNKNKIIDRAIEFIKCNTPQSRLRMAGATIAELELVKKCDLADVGDCVAFRICEHCNKEYVLILTLSEDRTTAVNNHQTCPHCKKRDDAWVKIKKKQH